MATPHNETYFYVAAETYVSLNAYVGDRVSFYLAPRERSGLSCNLCIAWTEALLFAEALEAWADRRNTKQHERVDIMDEYNRVRMGIHIHRYKGELVIGLGGDEDLVDVSLRHVTNDEAKLFARHIRTIIGRLEGQELIQERIAAGDY